MSRRTLRPLPRAALLTAAFAAFLAAQPGRAAAQLPAPAVSSADPFHLGGYGGVVVGWGGDASAVSLREASAAALVSGTLGTRLSYFGEVEAATLTSENYAGRREHDGVEVERLYAELSIADALRIRAGRFLTPVGQWNEIHAEPLTWTSLRPLTTYRPFAKSTTGLMISGQVALGRRDAGYAAYAAVPHADRDDAEEATFVSAQGGRVAVEIVRGLTLGASGARYRSSHPPDRDHEPDGDGDGPDDDGGYRLPALFVPDSLDEREEEGGYRRLAGADLRWTAGGGELLAEGVAVSGVEGRPAERGAFVQAAVPTVPGLYAVARGEVYEFVGFDRERLLTLGLTYRAGRHVVVKAQRQMSDHVTRLAPGGWFVSVSALF